QQLYQHNYWALIIGLKTMITTKEVGISITFDKNLSHNHQNLTVHKTELHCHKFLHGSFIPMISNQIITHNTRRFLRHLINARNLIHWYSQNRIASLAISQYTINWQWTYNYLNYESRPLARSTDIAASKLRAFKVKLLTGELPT